MSRPGNPAAIAVVAIALAVGLAPSRAAHAGDDDPLGLKRITVDRVEVTPSVLHGLTRLRVFVNAIDLETAGSVLDVAGKKTWTLEGTGLKNVPYLAGTFDGADAETAIVFVIQATDANPADLPKDKASVQLDVAGDLASIKKAIHEQLLDHLPSSTQVAVLGYGEDVTAARLTSAKQAGDQLDKIQLAEATDAPVLLTAVERGLRLLKKATPSTEGAAPESLRRILVVVSDGRDATDDRDRVTRIGKQADRQGVRIDSVAYSPVFRRRPMLTLGELSKRSQGVFRWVPQKIGDASFAHPFQKLLEEIRRQYVLTLFVPSDTVPRRLTVATTLVDRPLRSAPARLPAPGCGEDECGNGQYCVEAKCVRRATEGGRGVLGWILLIGGIALGGLVVLVGVGFVITKLGERKARPQPPPGAIAPGVPAPGAAPPAGAPPGAIQPAPAPGAVAAPAPGAVQPIAAGYRPAAGQPVLYVINGPQAGQRIPLRHGFTLGKNPGSDLSLAHDGFASGQHAQILMDQAGNCSLVDQGSTNGTFVNGVRITESRLSDGMAIRCGSTELRFLAQ